MTPTCEEAVRERVLERVKHGYYQLADQVEPDEEKIIAALFPDGAVCMHSALCHNRCSDYTPHAWDIAFPRTVSRSRLSLYYLPIEPYFVKDDLFALGRTASLFHLAQAFDLDCTLLKEAFAQTFHNHGRIRQPDDVRRLESYSTDARVQAR